MTTSEPATRRRKSARPSAEPFRSIAIERLLRLRKWKLAEVPGRHAARLVALAGPLHLDHVGAQVGQEQPGRGPGDDVAELEDAHALERKRGGHDAR